MPMKVCRSFGVLWVVTVLIAFGCSRSDDASAARPALTMVSLGQRGTEGWLASRLNASKPVHFFSNDGTRFCCEYPNVAIEFRSDHTVEIASDGWEPKRHIVTYRVEQDGRIALSAQSADFHESLKNDINYVNLVPNGAEIYLVQDLTMPSGPSDQVPDIWPLKFIEAADWLPPPQK
jgi:hypothetical protein